MITHADFTAKFQLSGSVPISLPSTDHQPPSMALDLPIGWEPWTAPALEDLLPRLSREEQVRLHSYLREHQRIGKGSLRSCSEGERDFMMIHHVRYALHHYNARHPGEEFDAVKSLMVAGAYSRGQVWYHLNFWACCRKTKKIKRFFAEVHYKTAFSALTNHHRFKELRSHPAALAAALFTGTCHHQSQERPPSSSSSSSVCSDLPPPVRGDEKPPSSSSSSTVCSDLPPPVGGDEKPPVTSSVFSLLSPPVPGAEKPSSNS
ncbi:hypothetical protein D1007_48019 [Hordeum vulgare]|uniref:uncharacterized protein LOC123429828 n=1 Tax=Hordeum vulgare subsp. vulgare TaxID=112509 RepID=UPI000B465B4A|nr:uncharacterized protein LOC123429828 [Hordeum vulgare subsp. vulgare]XP_044969746.1 uncharacterized protein LOC123429828 [Hordeum vulgare subsp. vulgare]KAE8779014.1 hypothetical protein D1007_48019 [Hordeum vulgare]